MNARERMLELICDCRAMEGYGYDLVEKQVDHLIANGVTVSEEVEELKADNLRLCEMWAKAVSDLSKAEARYVMETRWIPVTERLPEENGIYLTFNKKKQYEFHLFQTGKRMWQGIWEEDGVTHWMPLPEPPKENDYEMQI